MIVSASTPAAAKSAQPAPPGTPAEAITPPPVPDAQSPVPSPSLSPREKHLLALYITSKYDLAALTTGSDPATHDEVLSFTTSAAVQTYLELHQKFKTTSLHLVAIDARKTAINALEDVVKKLDDPIEKRSAAVSLYRATAAPIMPVYREPRPASVPPHDPRHPSPHSAAPTQPNHSERMPGAPFPGVGPTIARPVPRPRLTPRPDFTHAQVAGFIFESIARPDSPLESTGQATLVAFCDTNANINDHLMPVESPADAISELRYCGLGRFMGYPVPHGLMPKLSETAERSTAEYTSVCGEHTLNIRLTRDVRSRYPDCWLLTELRTTPTKPPPDPPPKPA